MNKSASGVGVDSFGGAVIDPTYNVERVIDLAVERLDDLSKLQAQLNDEKIKRMEREWIHQDTVAILRAEHYKEIRHAESDRVDKIRSVDVSNAAATAAQLLSAVTTLASSAQATAEVLRNQVASTAAAVAAQTERVLNPIIERVAQLEKSSSFGQGRAALADPAMADLVAEMRKINGNVSERSGRESISDPAMVSAISDIKLLLAAQQATKGRGEGSAAVWAGIAVLASLVIAAAAIGFR